ncbi:MAG: LysR family transcriptional regulator [Sphingobium sp.]
MFDRTLFQSFAILAQEQHFGRAARRLFVTQPALSRRIQQLEAELGVALFDRVGRRVELTPAGHALLPEAQAILARMEQARQVARDAGGLLAGRLSIGFDGAASYTLIPRLVAEAGRRMPHLVIDFSEQRSIDQMREVEFRRLDIGIVRPLPHDETIQTTCVLAEPLALAVPLGHRLAGRRTIRLDQIDGEAFVAYSENGLYLRDLIAGQLAGAGAAPRIVQSVPRTHSILALVSTGMGVAIVPAGSRAASFDNILFKPLALDVRAEWHAAWHRASANALVASMLDLMRTLDR